MNLLAASRYRSIALWAPEMATPGGVQSYMWRLWEMLHHVRERHAIELKGLTLKDTSVALTGWVNPTQDRPTGAEGSRARFIRLALGQQGRADLVIVGHINLVPVAWLAKRLRLIEDYIIILHGIEAWRHSNWLKRRAMKQARMVVATSRFTSTVCMEANDLPAGNFSVLPLCAEPNPDEPREGFRLDGEWPVLFVGRLAKSERYKGLETVIVAVAELQREGLPVKLHVIGDGDDRFALEETAARLIALGGVTFHGRVDGATLQAAYRSAKTFVMPSAKEGFGIVFLEAMRHAVPCIGGAHGGTPEVFVDGCEGLLVQFNQTEQLKAKLKRLMQSPEDARTIGAAGQQRFLRDYVFDAFARRWLDSLDRIALHAP